MYKVSHNSLHWSSASGVLETVESDLNLDAASNDDLETGVGNHFHNSLQVFLSQRSSELFHSCDTI